MSDRERQRRLNHERRRLAAFILSYVRYRFDLNDVMDDLSVTEVLRVYRKRPRWAEYPDFVDQIRTALGTMTLRWERRLFGNRTEKRLHRARKRG